MAELIATNLAWTGFYLGKAPSHKGRGWMRALPTLKNMGWGVVPIFLGRQWYYPGELLQDKDSPDTLGEQDGQLASELAFEAGFRKNLTVVYLDIEKAPPGGPSGNPRQARMVDYWRSWAKTLSKNGYMPGAYVSPLFASRLVGTDSPPWRVWAAYFPPIGYIDLIEDPFPLLDPKKCRFWSDADVWHWTKDRRLLGPKRHVLPSRYDLDSSYLPDPSAII
jgi:hypothetical protein